jgi:phage gp16-like protein
MKPALKLSPEARTMRAVYACRRQVDSLEDDDAWRTFIERVTGKRSLKEMTGAELGKIVDALHASGAPRLRPKDFTGRRRADSDQARMIRGLWLELHHLGAVEDPSEAAIAKFVRRQTGNDALAWIDSIGANKVIEALKAWVARARAVTAPYDEAMGIWRRLRALGAVENYAATDPAGYGYPFTGKAALIFYGVRDWEILLARLRPWVAAVELKHFNVARETAAAVAPEGDGDD